MQSHRTRYPHTMPKGNETVSVYYLLCLRYLTHIFDDGFFFLFDFFLVDRSEKENRFLFGHFCIANKKRDYHRDMNTRMQQTILPSIYTH